MSKINSEQSQIIELPNAGAGVDFQAGNNIWIITRLMENGSLDIVVCTLADKLALDALLSEEKNG